MLVSLKWLSEYVPLTLSPRRLAERLTLAGVKVERIVSRGDSWDMVVVGKVLEVEPHPNADRLRLVRLDIGEEQQPRVVCGAPNVAAGQKIAYAHVGARLRDGHTGEMTTLKAARIRGIESLGMVCSEKELGLSEQHEGILELPDDAPIGQPLQDYMGDTVFELEVTPNRPDHMSMLGVAWEVAAQTHVKVKEPERAYEEAASAPASQRTSVTIEDRDLCSRYLAGIVERVNVGPSPLWMQERLTAAGMRPINNIVDITNYVMLETGQPLHAFDLRRLGEQRIVVRRAREGERIRTLDGVERPLEPDMLVIADGARPVAVAGVMGGADSEVTDSTATILLEAANFNPISIRSTSGRIGLRTEASIRFEKGLHPELAHVAAQRAMKLLVDLTGGRAAKGLVDTYPVKRKDLRIDVSKDRIQQMLGLDLTPAQIRTSLTEVGFGCRVVPPDRFVVRVPYWRTDLGMADDIVEEVVRVTGYDNLPSLPLAGAIPPPYSEPVRELRERLRDAAVAAGLQEIITYPLTTPEALATVQAPEALEVRRPLRLENPMSGEQSVMRTSLRAAVLQIIAANLRQVRGTVAVFECARAYLSREGDLPDEREMVVGAIAGYRTGRWGEPTDESVDFFDLKGMLEETFERAGVRAGFRPLEAEYAFLRGHIAEVVAGDKAAGVLGQVHPSVASSFDIDAPVFLFELDIESLLPVSGRESRYRPLSRFPAVIQDLALIVDQSVPAGRVLATIRSSSLVTDAQIFDVYEGEPLPAGKRSLAFAVQFQSLDKTLTDAEVADARRRLVRRLEHEFGAELRGG